MRSVVLYFEVLLYYILKSYKGISTTEKNRISTRENYGNFGCRQGGVESYCCFNCYLDWCLKVAAAQIDA